VLPFVAEAGDGAVLAEGVSDEVMSVLSGDPRLRVIARGTAATLRHLPPLQAMHDIGATAVLSGRVRQMEAERLRVEHELSTSGAGRRPSSSTLIDLGDFRAGVSRLAAATLSALELGELGDLGEPDPSARGPAPPITRNTEALELFLQGRLHMEQRPIGVKLAMQCFDRALRVDGGIAAANGALAVLWANFGIFLAIEPQVARERALAHATMALAHDAHEPQALAALLTVATFFDWDLAGSDALAAELAELAPSYVQPLQVQLYASAARGDAPRVRELGRQVQQLDPRSVDPVNDFGYTLLLTGDAAGACEVLAGHLQWHPEASEVHRRLGLAHLARGAPGASGASGASGADARHEGVLHLERSVALSRRHVWGVANLACGLAYVGEEVRARALLDELLERADGELVPATALAMIHAALGDLDAGLAALERAAAARDYWLLLADRDPLLAPLRADARYSRIRERCTPVLTRPAPPRPA